MRDALTASLRALPAVVAGRITIVAGGAADIPIHPERDRILDEVRALGRQVADAHGMVEIPMTTRRYQLRRRRAFRRDRSEERRAGQRQLQVEQLPLTVEATAVAGETAVRADDTVARDDDADGVLPVRQSDRPSGTGRSNAFGQLAIGLGRTVGNLLQGGPDALLELRSKRGKGKVEGRELSSEVGVKLVSRGFEGLSVTTPLVCFTELVVGGAVPLQIHVETTDLAILGHDGQGTEPAVDHGVGAHHAAFSSGMWLIG